MPTYKLTLAYDGTDFAGWQKQEPPDPALAAPGERAPITTRKLEAGLLAGKPGRVALRTVQAVVERAVREVVREPVVVQGASRTDAGVHARAQVAVFACGEGNEASRHQGNEAGEATASRGAGGWPVERGVDRLLRAVNSRLPEDVQVVRAEVVREGFNPIGDCVAKGYSYTFWAGMHRPLWERRYAWHTWAALDVGTMQRAAAAFAAAGHGRLSTVREVYACGVREESKSDEATSISENCAEAEAGRMLRLEISGNGFLYNMVRIIAGTLHEVGRGRIDAGAIAEILASGDRRRAGPTLPPQGLCLEWINYREPSEPRA